MRPTRLFLRTLPPLLLGLSLAACAQTEPAPPSEVAAVVAVAASEAATEPGLAPSSLGPLRITTVASGLEHPWGLAFLPDGRALVTERPGRLRIVDQGQLSEPVTGLPVVWARAQGGLLDVALDPGFGNNQLVYLSYAEGGEDGRAGTAVLRARLVGLALEDVQVIFRQLPKLSTGAHFGGRLVFDRAGHLFVTLGENNVRASAQALDQHPGKVVRIHPDGTVPGDNPFVGRDDARPEIWSYGHRNPQGAALHPVTGELWLVEHGARGGDEVNAPKAGRNYGWPLVTHGVNYDGRPIPEAICESAPGMEAPLRTWVPSIAPSGMAFYAGLQMIDWQGDLFVGALAGRMLVRLDMDGERIVGEERLLTDFGERIRDVRNGPGDALYLLTDSPQGRLLRVELAKGGWHRETQGKGGARTQDAPDDAGD